MQAYKFYFRDDLGHVFRAQDQILQDDLAALEAAQKLRSDRIVEVWQSPAELRACSWTAMQ